MTQLGNRDKVRGFMNCIDADADAVRRVRTVIKPKPVRAKQSKKS